MVDREKKRWNEIHENCWGIKNEISSNCRIRREYWVGRGKSDMCLRTKNTARLMNNGEGEGERDDWNTSKYLE